MSARQELAKAIERWYVWLSSSPAVLFHAADMDLMVEPVSRFLQSAEWMSESAIAKHEWFVQKGAERLLNRLEKGDFDIYEQ
ncbi:hypothetical protein [Paenibacillus roseus]|uniref:hypothetical protein n=1 Tax=Paenibacillus sp. GCM10012307 TaxID=3317343 RepID=UPI0036D25368